ncbi:MAG: immunity protein Tsi6 family protein [Terricaulis sp.]
MIELAALIDAAEDVKRLRTQYRESAALKSIAEQLDYLIGVERGFVTDRSRIAAVNIGVIAARNVEDMDLGVAEKLQKLNADIARSYRGEPST